MNKTNERKMRRATEVYENLKSNGLTIQDLIEAEELFKARNRVRLCEPFLSEAISRGVIFLSDSEATVAMVRFWFSESKKNAPVVITACAKRHWRDRDDPGLALEIAFGRLVRKTARVLYEMFDYSHVEDLVFGRKLIVMDSSTLNGEPYGIETPLPDITIELNRNVGTLFNKDAIDRAVKSMANALTSMSKAAVFIKPENIYTNISLDKIKGKQDGSQSEGSD